MNSKIDMVSVVEKIFSRKWRWKAFEFIAKNGFERFVSGYELHRKFGVSLPTAYEFVSSLVEYGICRYPMEIDSRKIKITNFGLEIYEKLKHIMTHGPDR